MKAALLAFFVAYASFVLWRSYALNTSACLSHLPTCTFGDSSAPHLRFTHALPANHRIESTDIEYLPEFPRALRWRIKSPEQFAGKYTARITPAGSEVTADSMRARSVIPSLPGKHYGAVGLGAFLSDASSVEPGAWVTVACKPGTEGCDCGSAARSIAVTCPEKKAEEQGACSLIVELTTAKCASRADELIVSGIAKPRPKRLRR